MASKTNFILKATHVVFYIVFVALCILTGTLLFNYFFSQVVSPIATKNLSSGLNLYDLANKNVGFYHLLMWLLILASAAKALMFYFLVKIPHLLDLSQPFTAELSEKIFYVSYAAFVVALLLIITSDFSQWLTGQGIALIKIEDYLGGGEEFLILAGIMFFVANIFKRGVEIQTENSLTI